MTKRHEGNDPMAWLSRLFQRADEGEVLRVIKVIASRAVYSDPDIKERVEVRIEVEDKHHLTLDMNITQCAQLITQLTASHDAINPPLKANLRGAWS